MFRPWGDMQPLCDAVDRQEPILKKCIATLSKLNKGTEIGKKHGRDEAMKALIVLLEQVEEAHMNVVKWAKTYGILDKGAKAKKQKNTASSG
jgi:hypothetical protein